MMCGCDMCVMCGCVKIYAREYVRMKHNESGGGGMCVGGMCGVCFVRDVGGVGEARK